MARIKRLTDGITEEPYFRDVALGIQYRRILGAMAWPVDRAAGAGSVRRSGCAMVVAEHRKPDASHGVRPLRVLAEVEEWSVPELLRAVGTLRDEWLANDWLVQVESPFRALLDQHNRELFRHRQPRLKYKPAPTEAEAFQFGFRMVEQRVVGQKTLHLGPAQAARSELGQIQAADASKPPTDYPPLACLFWAVSELDLRQPRAWVGRADGYRAADARGGY